MPGMPTRSTKTKTFQQEKPVIEQDFPEFIEEPVIAEENTFTFKRSHFYALITVFAFAAGVLLGYIVWGFDTVKEIPVVVAQQAEGPVVEAPVTPQSQQPQYIRYDVAHEGFPSIGPEDAPIIIIEFSDYECPFCKRWHEEVYQPLLNAYPGKIRFVYRHLPLTSIHPEAFPAAEAVMCAGEQNAYWPYHDKLFGGNSLGSDLYIQYAQDLGLDMTMFEACITDHKYKEAVQTDMDFALNLGATSTPTFFINGLAVVGAQPLSVFQQVIDKELAGEIP